MRPSAKVRHRLDLCTAVGGLQGRSHDLAVWPATGLPVAVTRPGARASPDPDRNRPVYRPGSAPPQTGRRRRSADLIRRALPPRLDQLEVLVDLPRSQEGIDLCDDLLAQGLTGSRIKTATEVDVAPKVETPDGFLARQDSCGHRSIHGVTVRQTHQTRAKSCNNLHSIHSLRLWSPFYPLSPKSRSTSRAASWRWASPTWV